MLGPSVQIRIENLMNSVVGVTGFEPATPTSRTKSDASQALPSNDKLYYVKCQKPRYLLMLARLSFLVISDHSRIS